MSGRSKYGSRRTEYHGVIFASAREAAFAAELDLLVRAGEVRSYRRQVPIPLKVNDKLICKYVIDFVVVEKDYREEFIEVKGVETPTFKLKWKLFEALYPDLRKRIVK